MSSEQPTRSRRRWRWKVALGLVLVAPLVSAALLPAWLNSGAGRRWLLGRANGILAPARLDVASFRFSWFGSTRLEGVVLFDRDRGRVIDAPRAHWDRSLARILLDAPRFGTLVLDRAALDIERKADGTINLSEALRPVLRGDPKLDLKVVVQRGHLRFRSAALPEPVVADQANVTLDLAAAPRPLTWRVELAQGVEHSETLSIEGRFDRWNRGRAGANPDVAVRVAGNAWPWTIAGPGVSARGRFRGDVSIDRNDDQWTSKAHANIEDLDASGPRFGDDHLRLGRVQADWDVGQTAGTWDVRRLDVTAPIGALHGNGTLAGNGRIEGTLDIAALARELPHAFGLREEMTLEKGSALLSIASRKDAERYVWDVEARLTDVQARDRRRQRDVTLKAPATLTARITARKSVVSVERMALASEFLSVQGRGDINQGLSLDGTLDLAALQRQLAQVIDFGPIQLAGQGRLAGRYQRYGNRYDGSLETAVRGLRVEGLGLSSLHRDALELRLTAQGPVTAGGLPAALTAGRATLASGAFATDLTVRPDHAKLVWEAFAHAPTRLGDRDVEAAVNIRVREQPASLALERVDLRLTPKGGEPVVLRARGSFDRKDGTIALVAADGGPDAEAVRLAPDGITIRGLGTSRAFRAEGALAGDIAKIVRLLTTDASDLRGTWSARASASAEDGGLHLAGRVEARDLSPDIEGPVSLALDALAARNWERIDLTELALMSRYATVQASGRLSAGKEGRRIALHGTVAPGWDAINRLAARRVDPGARLAGRSGKLALEADLSELSVHSVLRSLTGEAGFALSGADFFGMRVGATPVVLRAEKGKIRVAPIDTTINEGRLHLEPEIALEGEDGAALRLGPESSLRDAAINDEVSHRVLSFVAPILESATRVRGRVSVDLEDAAFPIGGAAGRHAMVDGTVTFQDVEFVAGALVDDLLAIVGREPKASLRLNKPVELVIADGRIETQGLALPLGNVTEVAFDGSVDFDRRLNMTASLPVTRKMVLGVDFLGDIVEGTKVNVPIRGTLDHPQIDRDALKVGLKDLGKTLLERTAGRGAAELLMRLARPRDGAAPPRLTPAERRARRLERRMQRQGPADPGND